MLPPGLYGKYGAHGVRLGGHDGDGDHDVRDAEGGGEGVGASAAAAAAASTPLFTHLHGSSWHGSDAAAAIWAAHHGWALGGWGAALGVAVLSGGAVAYVRAARAAAGAGGRRGAAAHHRRRPSSAHLYSLAALPGGGGGGGPGGPAAGGGVPPIHPALDAAAKMC